MAKTRAQPSPEIHPIVIMGAGPAGYSAAIYAARASLDPLLIQGDQPGGQLMVTTDVENYPGFADVIQGPWLMEQMEAQARHVGTRIEFDHVIKVDLTSHPKVITTVNEKTYLAQSVVIATGAQAKWLGLPSEDMFRGFGVSGCATCDGFFFKNKKVAVVGGGNTAVEEALFLTNHASHVTLVHRRDTLRAEKILQDRLLSNPKISVIWNAQVDEILGQQEPTKRVTGLRLKDTQRGTLQTLDLDGVFIAIGHSPATELVRGQLPLDPMGYILVEPGTPKTKLPGVFAAGDVCDPVYRQAVTAAGLGCMAALDAVRYLQEVMT